LVYVANDNQNPNKSIGKVGSIGIEQE